MSGRAGGGPALHVERVVRRFGDVTAVDRASLTLEAGELVTLLGPSGCGKTTMLRLIAGFESPDEGRILFHGTDVTRWSPQRRGFGMVFQNYALFPHLNVFENIAFGLRSRGRDKGEIGERVKTALERVDLAGYGTRRVQELSGGQQQRVALARALAIEPPLLLLDEPLSNLDQALRVRTRSELRKLVKALGITALFVTHDQEEAFDLSDRIAVMNEGEIRQIGRPQKLYEEPEDRFVAGFVGSANWLRVHVEGRRNAKTRVRLPGGTVWELTLGEDRLQGEGTLLIRPEALRFAEEGEKGALSGLLVERRFRGAFTICRVDVAGTELEIVAAPGGPDAGERVGLLPRGDARFHVFGAPEGVYAGEPVG